MKEIIVFTHCDLDALGCALNIEYRLPKVKKKYFYTNYANIKEQVLTIKEYYNNNTIEHIFILDVSFGDNKQALQDLYNTGSCTIIDHHLYPEDFWDSFPDMNVIWDKTKCATLLCNEYFGNRNQNLKKLSEIINVYDIWLSDDILFPFAQRLNNYFWVNDIEVLRDSFITNDFNPPDDFIDVTNSIIETYTSAIADYEQRQLIQRSQGITLAFIDDWFNQVMIEDMKNGQDIVVGLSSYGIIRVRIRHNAPYMDEQKDKLRMALTGTTTTGHMNAFTYKVDNVSFQVLMQEAQKIVQEIAKL